MFDLKMHQQNHNVCLTLDNFLGHDINYQPTNVQIEFFEPNLTAFVQPLDAGVIRCFKAHYRRAFCQRALDLDDAGEHNIYNVTLLEAMLMAEDAWDSILSTTIEHCWDHTKIQCPPIMLRLPQACIAQTSSDSQATAAWTILKEFATTDMGLPEAEQALKDHFEDQYIDSEWRPALDAVMAAENDTSVALENIKKFRLTSYPNPSAVLTTFPLHTPTAQCTSFEADLMESVAELKNQNRIFGPLATIEELVNPVEEQQNQDSLNGPMNESDIIAQVHHEQALKRGDIEEVVSEEEDSEEDVAQDGLGTTTGTEMNRGLQAAQKCVSRDRGWKCSGIVKEFVSFSS
jgi:hypothetical protein